MKVIIIGAGIGGLSAYHSLKKHLANNVTIKIYECHERTTKVEGDMGLAPNGMRAIASIAPKAVEYIQTNLYRGPVRNSSGRLLGKFYGHKERYGFDRMMVRRAVVRRALLLDVPADVITWNSKLQSIRETNEGVKVRFANSSFDMADLVIGADGVWSMVRKCIFKEQYAPVRDSKIFITRGDDGSFELSQMQTRDYPPVCDGFSGVGGLIPVSLLSPRLKESLKYDRVSMTSGSPGLLFGYSLTSPFVPAEDDDSTIAFIQWWSIYESPTHLACSGSDPSTVRAHLLRQYASWKSPHDSPDMSVYEEIINLGCTEKYSFNILPRCGASRKPSWCSPSGTGQILLLGDAAHAMPPDSGQGASCAVEDAVAIGVLLHKFLEVDRLDTKEALESMVGVYEEVRMERIQKIMDLAKKYGNGKKKQLWFQQSIRDLFLGLLCKLPGSINDQLYMYNVEVAVGQYVNY